jgi:hypothetical protein
MQKLSLKHRNQFSGGAESLEDSVESIIVFVRVRNVSIQPAVEPLDNG